MRNLPTDIQQLLACGRNLRGCGYPSRALPFFLRAAGLYPEHAEAQQELKRTRDEIHRLQGAVEIGERRVADRSADARTWFEMGQALERVEQEEEALDAYESALEQEPEGFLEFEILFAAGNLLNNLDMYEGAIEVFDEIIDLLPDEAVGYSCKAMVLGNMGRYEETLNVADRAIALDPNDIGAWYNRVKALSALGRIEEAREARRRENAARRASGVPKWMPRDDDDHVN